jgi:manganese/zinc/iron transport system permease protein
MMLNPYWGKSFFGFFSLLVHRVFLLLTGQLSWSNLASDEVQLLVLFFLSIASALIGTFLVLKRMTMLANSLGHTILLGIVIAYAILTPFSSEGGLLAQGVSLEVMLIASLATGILTTVLTQLLTHLMKLQEDASIGLVFTCLFAMGIIAATLFTRNAHIGVEAIMGNIDALHFNDLKLTGVIAMINLVIVLLFFKEFKMISFDTSLAQSSGLSVHFFNYLLMVLVSATAIGAFRAVGVLLFLSFLVGLPLIARLLTHHLHRMIPIALGVGCLCSLIAVALSRHLLSVYKMPVSTAGLVVTLIGVFYLLAALFSLSVRLRRVQGARNIVQ